MYKALNTFIDDLFAFIIKMPTMHRLSCFRDGKLICIHVLCSQLCYLDIIFVIYLYQRWIYPTDYTRVNEFGQGGVDADASTDKAAETAAPLTDGSKKDN